MTPSTTEAEVRLAITADDRRIARHAAAAIVLAIAEAAIPTPLPGVKPGLANIVVLIVLQRHGWGDAAWVSLLRVFAAALLMGQLFAPGFFLSLGGALASLAALAATSRLPARLFGPVTHSLAAAFAHVGAQLLLARVWLVPHDGVFHLLPAFAAAAFVFGIVNGLVASHFLAGAATPPRDPERNAP
ncbi:MAG TPA: Gx transporter family protein [Rhodocyclaceae bacterium]|nr:Gx transporter family protein [Rhodocyclaceae bacterium]HNH36421.1 Gx transporter family protein [Rhodocyclaceae bacterium]